MASKKSAKPTLQKREDSNTGPPKKLEATYGKLMLRLAQEYDQSQVASLTVRDLHIIDIYTYTLLHLLYTNVVQ
jgi:hypothetical protein